MFALAVWFISVNYVTQLTGKLIIVLVPTQAAANTTCTQIRPALRQMWLAQAQEDCVIKAVHDKFVNNDYLFRHFVKFEDVVLPK